MIFQINENVIFDEIINNFFVLLFKLTALASLGEM